MAGDPTGVKRDPQNNPRNLTESNSLSTGGFHNRVSSSRSNTGKFVSVRDGIFAGAFGSNAESMTIASGNLEIKNNSTGSTVMRRVIHVNPATGTTDTLDHIDCEGFELPYQELLLIGIAGDTITITHDVSTVASNERKILCTGDSDFTLNGDEVVYLIYDYSLTKWVMVSGGGGQATFPLDYTIDDKGTTSGTLDHNLGAADAHMMKIKANGNVTITNSNIPVSGTGIDWYVEITQDSTGGRTVTWPSAVEPVPNVSTTKDIVSLIALHTDDGGTIIRALTLQNAGSISGKADTTLDNLASVAINTSLISDADDTDDLGSASKEWRNIYIDGTAEIDTLSSTNGQTFSGSTMSVNTTLTALNSPTTVIGDGTDDDLDITARLITSIIPKTDNNVDLGSSSLEWKDLYIDGKAFIDTADIGLIDNSITFTGLTTTINSATINLGDAVTDTLNINAQIGSDFIPITDGTYDLGLSGEEWQDIWIDGIAHIDRLDIDVGVGSDLTPITDDSVDLGTTDLKWKDLWIDGTATIDTLSFGNCDSSSTFTGTTISFGDASTDEVLFLGMVRLPVDTDATRSTAGTAGRIIFNSDDGQINVDDGTNWTLPDGTTT